MRNFQFSIFNFQTAAALFIIWILSFGFPVGAQQQPEFMITWKADTYAPSEYRGRVLPAGDSLIQVGFELIDSGRLADLSGSEVQWFVNGTLQKSGFGLKNFSFKTNRFSAEEQLKIAVTYRGRLVDELITIPTVTPEVVIDARYPDNQLLAGLNRFRALLFFFNIDDLNQADITWSANGSLTEGLADDPDILNLDTAKLESLAAVNLQVEVNNLANPLEIAAKFLNLTIK